MKKIKSYSTIVLILLCLLMVNFFLPFITDGKKYVSLCNSFIHSFDKQNVFLILAVFLIYFSPLLLGIINCILFKRKICKHYKYALCPILVPYIIFYVMFSLPLLFYSEGTNDYISIAAILGPILSIASLVVVLIGDKKDVKMIENNASIK